MKLTAILFGLSTLLAPSLSAETTAESAKKSWGAKIELTEAISLDDAIKKMPLSGEILVQGKALQVCQKKGCWLTLGSTNSDVRVTFKDYGFFVPFSLKDQTIKAQGLLKEEVVSVSDQKHFLKDEGRPQAEIDAITAPKKSFTFVASGVEKL
jgi:hypothetical protein